MAIHLSDADVLINLGCGSRYHPRWRNFDLHPVRPGIEKANFLEHVPVTSNTAMCVYHSHVLEHLPYSLGASFVRECWRCLKEGGILRVVVPDIEYTMREYIRILDAMRSSGLTSDLIQQHEWIQVEMLDQLVRETREGMMGSMISSARADPAMVDYLAPRLGEVGRALRSAETSKIGREGKYEKLMMYLRKKGSVGRGVAEWMIERHGIRHKWMYDEFSLGALLRQQGFRQTFLCKFDESRIAGWDQWRLDSDEDGLPYKGGSLYMEAIK